MVPDLVVSGDSLSPEPTAQSMVTILVTCLVTSRAGLSSYKIKQRVLDLRLRGGGRDQDLWAELVAGLVTGVKQGFFVARIKRH